MSSAANHLREVVSAAIATISTIPITPDEFIQCLKEFMACMNPCAQATEQYGPSHPAMNQEALALRFQELNANPEFRADLKAAVMTFTDLAGPFVRWYDQWSVVATALNLTRGTSMKSQSFCVALQMNAAVLRCASTMWKPRFEQVDASQPLVEKEAQQMMVVAVAVRNTIVDMIAVMKHMVTELMSVGGMTEEHLRAFAATPEASEHINAEDFVRVFSLTRNIHAALERLHGAARG